MTRGRALCTEDHSGEEWVVDHLGGSRFAQTSCSRCGEQKPWSEFYYNTKRHKAGHNSRWCMKCHHTPRVIEVAGLTEDQKAMVISLVEDFAAEVIRRVKEMP